MRVDSLQILLQQQEEYIDVLRNVMSGELKLDSVTSLDSLTIIQREKLALQKTQQEQDFCEEVEQQEQFNLSQVIVETGALQYVFYRPVSGVLLESFEPNIGRYGVSIMTSANELVMATLAGRVVVAEFSMEHKWVVILQHEDNYLSVYKGMNRLQVQRGDVMRAGEVIGRMGDDDEAMRNLDFELWKKGVPVNPEDVMVY